MRTTTASSIRPTIRSMDGVASSRITRTNFGARIRINPSRASTHNSTITGQLGMDQLPLVGFMRIRT